MPLAPHLYGFIDIIVGEAVRQIEAEEAAAIQQRAAAIPETTKAFAHQVLPLRTRRPVDDVAVMEE